MRRPLLVAIRLYQRLISPALGIACRYEPSCSRYAYEAIETHGAARGLWLATKRLGRCRPGGGSGYDPVPAPPGASETPGLPATGLDSPPSSAQPPAHVLPTRPRTR